MRNLIDVKPKGSLLDIKPKTTRFLDIKPTIGQLNRISEDDVIVRLFAGMPIGPGFFMYITYSTQVDIFP